MYNKSKSSLSQNTQMALAIAIKAYAIQKTIYLYRYFKVLLIILKAKIIHIIDRSAKMNQIACARVKIQSLFQSLQLVPIDYKSLIKIRVIVNITVILWLKIWQVFACLEYLSSRGFFAIRYISRHNEDKYKYCKFVPQH